MQKLYKNSEGNYVLELWSSSTKHPDSIFHFENFEKSPYFSDESQLFQWVCECASKLSNPCHAKELVEWGLDSYQEWVDLANKIILGVDK